MSAGIEPPSSRSRETTAREGKPLLLVTFGGHRPSLQERELRVFRRRIGETNADADQPNWFSGARECFGKKCAEILQIRREPGALGCRPCKIVQLQFHEDLCHDAGCFFLRE